MKISIITINYNSSESTIKLLESLQEQTDKDFQTFVIDNASEEADLQNLKNYVELTRTALVRNSQNLGFSGGNNVGIKMALNPLTSGESLQGASGQAEWVFLLNNDTWVESGFIASLRAKLSRLKDIVGVPLDEGGKVAYTGKIQWLKPTLKHSHKSQVMNHGIYVIGGALLVHRDVFSKTGLLDEKYFLYFEDADFSLRAQKAGFKLTIMEELKVYHQVSASTKKLGSPLLLRYHYRNALYFNWRNGPWYIKILVWPWSFWIIKKQLLKIMFMYKQPESFAILSGIFDFYKNRMGKI